MIITLGISSCLLGNNVRYDGGHRREPHLPDVFGRVIEWIPICPEVECGMSVPREPMRLVDDGKGSRLVTIDSGRDLTGMLSSWLHGRLAQRDIRNAAGFVFKARSPSCAVSDAAICDSSGRETGKGAGLFARAVGREFPGVPLADEERLRDAVVRDAFMEQVFAVQRRRG